jgi:hypothetical protein
MLNTQAAKGSATEEEINEQVVLLSALGYGVWIHGEKLVKVLGLKNADVMRKRYARGSLPFLKKDERGFFCTHIRELARFLAELHRRDDALSEPQQERVEH